MELIRVNWTDLTTFWNTTTVNGGPFKPITIGLKEKGELTICFIDQDGRKAFQPNSTYEIQFHRNPWEREFEILIQIPTGQFTEINGVWLLN